jgi:hypothetical protein
MSKICNTVGLPSSPLVGTGPNIEIMFKKCGPYFTENILRVSYNYQVVNIRKAWVGPRSVEGKYNLVMLNPVVTTSVAITYLFTPWSRVLLEKLTGLQLVKKFPASCGTRRFLTALTSARHLSLSWANQIQSSHPHPTSWRSILVLSSHLHLGLPSGLFPLRFPHQNPVHTSPFPHTCYMPHLSHYSRYYHPHDIG